MGAIFDKAGWVLAGVVSLAVLAALAGLVSAGPLDPPGPVASTGKTQINSLPYSIDSPGSYVLNGNLTCTSCTSGQNGITIRAGEVTLDLQGFALDGVAGSGTGIVGAGSGSVTIRDGVVNNWGQTGIDVVTGVNNRLEDLRASSNGLFGIGVNSDSDVTRSSVYSNGCAGILVYGSRNTISYVDASRQTQATASCAFGDDQKGISIRGSSNVVQHNISIGNADVGIYLNGITNLVADNVASDNWNKNFELGGDCFTVAVNTAYRNTSVHGDFVNVCATDAGVVGQASSNDHPFGNITYGAP